MSNSIITMLLLFCAAVCVCAAVPTAHRTIIYDSTLPSQCLVRIEVSGASDSFGKALLLSENWPEDAEVLAPTWNGRPFAPNRCHCRWRWLFGYGEGSPAPGAGVLEYMLRFGGSFSRADSQNVRGLLQLDGSGAVEVAGMDDLRQCCQAGEVVELSCQLEVNSGWNLLRLPCAMDVRELQAHDVNFWMRHNALSHCVVQLEGDLLPADVPLWGYRDAAGKVSIELSWGELMDDATRLDLSGRTGWQLVGGADCIGWGWSWDGMRYRRVRQEELNASQSVWQYVDFQGEME